jgi:hypothetical protein
MEEFQDFKELLGLFDSKGIEYVIVGAHALAYHGAPRYTGDLDIYVRPVAENARKVVQALEEFGFGSLGLNESDFVDPGKVVQLGYPPARVDLLTSLSGVSWEEVSANWDTGELYEIPVRYIGRNELVTNKRSTGRKKDFADLEALGES